MEALSAALVDWGCAGRAMPGQIVSGDRCVVLPFSGGVLLGVIDGLGHGMGAAAASAVACEVLSAHPDEPLIPLFRRCHEGMRGTRGAVMTLATVRRLDGAMEWMGVGNVEAVLVRASPEAPREAILLRGGVVGYHIPPLRSSALGVAPGDVLVFVSDGIRYGFAKGFNPREAPQAIADDILARWSLDTDDAMVLVARLLASAS